VRAATFVMSTINASNGMEYGDIFMILLHYQIVWYLCTKNRGTSIQIKSRGLLRLRTLCEHRQIALNLHPHRVQY
jgi:hypothetical protein